MKKNNKIKALTKAEEQVMQLLWEEEKAFVKDLVEKFPKPLPAYNTVSTIIRILENKGFIDHESFGKSHQYYPLISKEEYGKYTMEKMVEGYFEGSFSNLLSFFAKEKNPDVKEVDELMSLLEKIKNEKK